jgi:hypothetical protein
VGSRLYVGYGSLPASPDPNSTQFYGWIEFSKGQNDTGVWLNLSNVDIVGMALTLKGNLADTGHPFSLGYQQSQQEIVSAIRSRALTSEGPPVLKDCGGGRVKVVAPNIQFPFYRRYDDYLDALTTAGAELTIRTDTPVGAAAKTFTGSFARGTYRDVPDADPLISLTSGSDSFQIAKSQCTTEYLYRCDGGRVVFNGEEVPQNRPDNHATDVAAVYTNSLFRNFCIGFNEGYFTPQGPNDSSTFASHKPFQNGRGNVYAQLIHEASNSYGFPYADANLKTLVVAATDSPITLTILRDDEAGDYQA